jgi:hypothetical protein
MAGHAFFTEHRCKTSRLLLICLSLVGLLWGCGDGPTGQATSDNPAADSSTSGSAAFAIKWHEVSADQASGSVMRAIDDCAGVASITCDVYDESHNHIASGGPWNCADHHGTIAGIPPGSNIILSILGWSATSGGGDARYHGQSPGVTINPGDITYVGTIDAYGFVPHLASPANGQTLTANAFSLAWDSVATAHQYRILVSEDSVFAIPIIDEQTSLTTYMTNNLSASKTYHWKIRSIDRHGNESADSEVWQFNTDATETCDAPVLDPIGNQQVDEGAALTLTLNAADPDGGNLTYSASSLPQGANFDGQTRVFSWTPGYGAAGNYPVTFTVCDDCPEAPLCDSEPITITVGDICQPPVLDPIGNRQVDEGVPLTFTVSASDPDGDTLTYNASSLPQGAYFDNQTRMFSWTPNYGDADNYPVTFQVCDDCPDGPLCDQEQITITVGKICRPPVLIDPGDQQGTENTNLTFTVSASDPDGGTLTYHATNLPYGAAFNENTRTFSWIPGYESAGEYTATFQVCDDCPDGPLCDELDVTIIVDVGVVCRSPVLTVPSNQQVTENTNLTFTVSATDLDGGTLIYHAINMPYGATFDENSRTFSWTPGSESAGEYTVTFQVCDDCPDGSLCDEKNVKIEVLPVPIPDSPVLLEPVEGATMDNGCLDKSDPIEWDFEWEVVPGAVQYQIYVFHTGSLIPLIDTNVYDTAYHYSGSGYIAEANRYEWTWHVRAMNQYQQWGKWSEWRYFNVEPVGADCMVYFPLYPIVLD